MIFHEPSVALPSLVSFSSSFNDLLTNATDDDNDDDGGWMNGQVDVSRQLHEARVVVNATDVDVDYLDEGPSMTLRDILLQADMTQFDLLGKYLSRSSFCIALTLVLLQMRKSTKVWQTGRLIGPDIFI
jgi:hypothetical protein